MGLLDTAVWLLGPVVDQPVEFQRLRRIRRSIYSTVAPLRAEIVRSPEPIPFDELDRDSFEPIKPGTAWGRVFDCAWLRITGEVPPGVTDAVVLLGIRGEGLVVAPDGEILDGISTVWQQGDLPHSGGKYRPVRNVDLSSGRVELYADVAHNGVLLWELGKAVYHGAHLAIRDDEAYGFYYDYLTLVVLAKATDDAAARRPVARRASRRVPALRGPTTSGAAREVLAPLLAAPSTSDFVYDAVGHGHLDQAWLWPIRETRRKAARTYARQLVNIDERPDYVYGTSQPQQMQWMKERHPALFERMKRAVAAGRLELQGSFWVETDTNMPGGESLVRQSLVGRRFLQEEFGLTDDQLRLCWLPDTFGYSGNLPQILKKSGMDWFQTIKISWNKVNVFPHRTFHWQGIDGSTVLVHMPPEGDYNSRGAADGLLRGLRLYPERKLDTALLVYGSGDGGGGPGEIHLELTERERSLRGLPQVKPGRAVDFFRRLEKRSRRDRDHLRRRALPRDPPGHVHDSGRDQGGQPADRAQAPRGRGTRRDPRGRLPGATRAALARRAAAPLPRHPSRLVDRAGQSRGSRDLRADRGRARRVHRRAARRAAAHGRCALGGQPLPGAARRARRARRRLVPGAARAVLGGCARGRGVASGARATTPTP